MRSSITGALGFILVFPTIATAAVMTVSIDPSSSPLWPIGTNYNGFTSISTDPLGPFNGQAVQFRGTSFGGTTLIYKYGLLFDQPVYIQSVTVSGAAFNGSPNYLAMLDSTGSTIGQINTGGGNSYQSFSLSPTVRPTGTSFFLEEFDTSGTWRYRDHIVVNYYAIPTVTSQWIANGGGTWSSASNWSGAAAAGGVDSGVLLSSGIAGPSTITVDNPVTVGTLLLDNTRTYTLAGPAALTLQVSSGSASIQDVGGNHSISAPLALASDTNVAVVNAADTLTINGGIAGSHGLSKSGNGTMTLGATNSYSGGTTINAGVVQFTSPSAIAGAGRNVTVNAGGAAAAGYPLDQAFSNRIAAASTGAVAITASSANDLDFNAANLPAASLGATGPYSYSGILTPCNSTYRLGGGGGILTVSSALSGAGNGLVVSGSVTLTAANTYGGGTTVQAGTLQAAVSAGGGNNALGTGAVALQGGTLRLSPSISSLSGTTAGFAARYYNFTTTSGGIVSTLDFLSATPVATRADATINFNNETNSSGFVPSPPVAGLNGMNSAAIWNGLLTIANGGPYAFQTLSDDGSLLYVDGTQVVWSDRAQATTTVTGNISLAAGLHLVTIKYAQGGGGSEIIANYSGADTSNAMVAIGSLSNTVVNAPLTTTLPNNLSLAATNTIDLAADTVSSGAMTSAAGAQLNLTSIPGYSVFTQSGSVALGGILTVNTLSANAVISGNIADSGGAGGLLKSGPGTLVLAGTNSYSGGTAIRAGTLALSGGNALPASGGITFSGGLLQYSPSNSVDYSAQIVNSSAAMVIDTNGQNVTYAGAIGASNTAGLTKLGAGTLLLSNANNYSGGTQINAGAVNIKGDASLGAATGPLTFTGSGTLQAGANIALSSSRNVTINSGAAATIDTQAFNMSVAGSIAGQGSLTKAGSGTLTLSGGNIYSGKTFLTSGAIVVNTTNAGGLYEGLVSNTNGADATDPIPPTSVQPVARWGGPGPFTPQGNNIYPNWGDFTTWGYGGYLLNKSNAPVTYTFGKNFDDNVFLVIDGVSVLSNTIYFQNVTASITLAPGLHSVDLRFGQGGGPVGPYTGAYNNYGLSYNTVGNTGTDGTWLQMGAGDSNTQFLLAGLPNSALVMSSNTTLDLSAANMGWVVLGSLADASGSPTGHQVLLGGNTLQVGSDNSSTTFSGTISGNGGSLTKNGSGVFTLAGTNSYSGGTVVNAGVLQFNSPAAIAGAGRNVTVGAGAAASALYPIDQAFLNRIVANSAGAVAIGTSSANDLDFSPAGANLSLASLGASNPCTYSGLLTPYNGAYRLGGGGATLTVASVLGGNGSTLLVNGNVALAAANTYTGATTIAGGTLQLGNGGTSGSLSPSSAIIDNAALALNRANTITQGVDFAGVISGSGGVVQSGSGTSILTGANTFSGGVMVSGGTLQLGNGGTTGSIDNTSGVSVANGATFALSRADNLTFTLTVSGPGNLLKMGTNTLTLTSPNFFSGVATISSGKVIAGGTGLGIGTLNVAGSLTVAAPATAVRHVSQYYNLSPANYYGTAYQTVKANNALLDTQTPSLVTLAFSSGVGDQLTTFDYGTGAGFLSPYNSNGQNFYVRWTGPITIPVSGNYTFYTASDDGSLLAIDGNTVVSNNYPQGVTTRSGTINLTAGLHAMTTIYNQGGGGYGMSASISSSDAGISQQTIPASMLQSNGLYLGGLQGSGRIEMAGNNLMVGWNNASTTFSGTISDSAGTGTLLKAGDGALALAGANTYTGPTTVGGGTLQLGNGGTTGSLSPSSVITDNATLAFNRANTIIQGVDFASVISGMGGVLQSGSGSTLILTGTNTYSGGTAINGGTLSINQEANLGAVPAAFQPANISFNGGVLRFNAGTGAPGAYTLNFNRGITLGPAGGTINANFVNTIQTSGQETAIWYNGAITGSGGLTITGIAGGSQANQSIVGLNGHSTYLGGTTVNSAVLEIANVGGPYTNVLPVTTVLNLVNSGVFNIDANASSQTIAGLAGDATGRVGTTNQGNAIVLTINSAGSCEFDGVIGAVTVAGKTGSDIRISLVKTGSGSQTLAGNNTFAGGTTISAGTLQLGNNAALGASTASLAIGGGAVMDINGYSPTVGSLNGSGLIDNVAGGGTPALTVGGGGGNGTFSGTLQNTSGTLALVKIGTGTQVLGGASTYGGGTTITAGVLQVGNSSALGAGSAALAVSGGTLDLHGYGVSVGPLSGTGIIDNLSGSGSLTAGNGGASGTFAGTIQNTVGQLSLTKVGTGTLVLAASNGYAGTTLVSAGTLVLAHSGALAGSTLDSSGGALSFGALNRAAFGGLQGSGNLALSNTAAAAMSLSAGGNNANTLFSGALNGTGNLTKVGTGILALAGASTYSGGTTITAGVLQAGNNAALGLGSGALTVSAGTLDVHGYNLNVGAFNGGGTINNLSGSGSLTAGNGDASGTFAGTIQNTAGQLSLTKAGTGTLVLAASNGYAGTTLVAAGTLVLAHSGALAGSTLDTSGGGALSFGALNLVAFGGLQGPGNLALSNTAAAAVSLSAGGNNASTLFSGALNGSGNLTKIGSGILALAGASTYSGGTTITAGVLQAGNNAALGFGSGPLTVSAGTLDVHGYSFNVGAFNGGGTINNLSGSGSLTAGNGDASGTFAGTIQNTVGQLSLTKAGTGTLVLAGSNGYAGTTLISAGTLVLANSGALSASTLDTSGSGLLSFDSLNRAALGGLQGPGNLALGNTAAAAVSLSAGGNNANTLFSGALNGSGNLTKIGSGILALTGTSTYSGGTTINGGVLQVLNATALGAVTAPLTLNGGTLDLQASAVTVGALLGNGGTVLSGSAGNSATLTLKIASGSKIYRGVLADGPGTLALIKSGGGAQSLAGANTYSGGTMIGGGILNINSDAALGAATGGLTFSGNSRLQAGADAVVVGAARNLVINSGVTAAIDTQSYNMTVAAPIAGGGGMQKIGDGTLTLAASNSYTGTTLIPAGTLLLANTAAISASSLDTSGGGALSFGTLASAVFGGLQGSGDLALSNTAAAAVALSVGGNNASTSFSGGLSGNGSLTKVGAGTLTFSGNAGLAGAVTVSGGTVSQSDGYLQAPTLNVDGGAYTLSGAGQVLATNAYVGSSGQGVFNQTGGTNVITNSLYLGSNPGSSGTYNLVGGLLVVTNILQGAGSSSLNISGGSLTGLGNGLTFSAAIVLAAGSDGTFDTSSSSFTLAGQVSGNGALTKRGPGTLVLSGSDDYSGGTYVYDGTLEVSNPHALGDGTSLTVGAGGASIFAEPAGDSPAPPGSSPGGAAVPEPPALLLLAVGVLLAALAACRPRMRRPARHSGRHRVDVRRACLIWAGLGLAGAFACGSSPAWSATLTWSGTATGPDWSDPANWGGTLPGSADTGLFSAASYPMQPSLLSPASIGGIWNTGGGSVTIGGAGGLTLLGASINGNAATAIEIDAGAGPLTIIVPLVLQNNQQWINNSASPLTVNGAVGGNGSLSLLGSGMFTLTGVNTYGGNTTVDGGTLQLAAGQLTSPYQFVGNAATGSFVQSGGTNALGGSGALYLGNAPGASGSYNLGGGALSAPTEFLGYCGSGSFTQSGGTHAVAGILSFGYSTGGSGTYSLGGNGLLWASYEYLGQFGGGSFAQAGGTNSVSNLYLGVNANSSGIYNLGGSGSLSAATEVVGFSGSGGFTQSGGTHALSGTLFFGYLAKSSGTYGLGGSGLLTAPAECIGWNGSGSFTQSGGTHSAGSLRLAQNANSAGTYNLNGGSLGVSALTQGAGAATFNFGGGTLGALVPWNSSLNMNISGIGGPSTVDTTGGNISLSGNLSGAGGLTKIGAGMLTLSGNNQYSGATNVSGGILQIGPKSLLPAAGTITVSNGATLAVSAATNLPGNTILVNPGGLLDTTAAGGSFLLGPGTVLTAGRPSGLGTDINGNLALGGGTLNIGGTGTAAALTQAGGLTLGGGVLMFDLSSTGASDLAAVAGLNLNATTAININMLDNSLSNGMYGLISYSGGLGGSVSALTLNGVANGAMRQAFSLVTTAPSAGTLALLVSGNPAALVWTGQQTGQWDPSSLNWSNSGAADKFYQVDAVTFNDTASASAVTLNAGLQPGNVLVNNNSLTYAFSGSGGISGSGSLTKSGSGTLVVSLSNAYSGGTTITAGLLQAGHNSALGAGSGALAVNGGTLDVHGYDLNVGALNGTGTIDNSGGSGSLTVGNGNASGMFSGTIQNTSGQLSLNKIGSGILSLSGNVALAGAATVSGGALNQSAGSLQASTIVVDGGAYTLSGTGQIAVTSEYVGSMGSGTFNQTSGTNTITNALYLGTNPGSSGAYNLIGGVLLVPSILQGSGSSSLNITNGVVAGLGSGVTIALPIVLTSSGSNGTIDTSSSSLTVTSQISGSGGLAKTGSATLVLAGDNTYSGDTTVAQGAVLLSNSNAAQNTTVAVSVDNGLQFSSDIGAFNVGAIAGSGGLALADSGGAPITLVTGGNNSDTTYSGVISGAGVLVHNGSGDLLLTGSNSYSGGTILGPDALGIGNPGALGTGALIFAGNATVYFTSSMVLSNTINIAAKVTGTVDTAPYTLTLSGPITGLGGFNKTGSGTLILGNSNDFSGGASISQGALELANAAALQNSTVSINVDNGLQFSSSIGGFNVGGLSGSNALTLSDTAGGPVTLTVGSNDANTTFSGSIAGNGTLVKDGNGSLTLTGSNSFTGGLVLDPGIVAVNGDFALGAAPVSPATKITFVHGISTLQALASFTMAGNRNISIGPDATATFDTNGNTLAIGGVISGSGALAVVGSGTLVLTNSETFTGGTTISMARLQLGNGGSTGWLNGNIVDNGVLVFDRADSAATFSGAISGSGSVQQAGSGTLLFGGTNTYTGTTTISAGTIKLGNATALQSSTVILSGGSLNLNNLSAALGGLGGSGSLAASGSLTLGGNGNATTYSGALSGGVALIKIGSGMLALTGSNSFSGGTTLEQGMLAISSDAALGAVPGSPSTNVTFATNSTLQAGASLALSASRQIAIGAGATATFDTHGNTLTVGGLVSGSGALAVAGGGTLVLTNADTYSGGTTIGPGTLQLGNGGSTGWLNGDIVDNGLLVFSRADSGATFSAAISGSGSVQQAGNGTLVFGGTNTFTGTTTISAGILRLGNATALQNSTVVPSGGTLDLNGFDATLGGLGGSGTLSLTNGTLAIGGNGSSTTFRGTLLGLASLIKTGSGLCVLAGNNGYSGTTKINSGILEASTTGSIPGLFTVNQVSVAPSGLFAVGVGGAQQWTAANIDALLGPSTFLGSGGTLGIDTSGGNFSYGPITAGGLGLVKLGSHTLTLAGTSNYPGNTLVSGGALELTTTATLAGIFTPGSVSVAGGATLMLAVGGSQQWTTAGISRLLAVNGLFGPGASLALDTNGGNFSLGSVGLGSIALTVVGSNCLTLTGSNSCSGVTNIGQGALQLAHSAALVNSTVVLGADNGLQFSPGIGTYRLGGLSGGNLLKLADTAGNAVGLVVGSNGVSTTFSGHITGSGSLIKTGGGNLVLSGSNSYSGGTDVYDGTLYLAAADTLADGTSLTIDANGASVFASASSEMAMVRPPLESSPAATAVPEPRTLLLLAVGALLGALLACSPRKLAVRGAERY